MTLLPSIFFQDFSLKEREEDINLNNHAIAEFEIFVVESINFLQFYTVRISICIRCMQWDRLPIECFLLVGKLFQD